MAAPALQANAEENDTEAVTSQEITNFDIDATQAISEIDSVGVEEEITEDAETGSNSVMLRAAAYKNKTYSYKRGGFAAWCKDFISYKYNGTRVAENSKWQEAGYIFPNIIKKKGISNYANGSGYKDYRGTKTYKIGSPTPWGDISVAQFDRSDYYRVKSNGSGYLK
ncbi:lacticin RM [Listeria sp. PSOL-1]|uniref:lacticin RM n=1 Tax=Listeria sp. PSOL-1 TaxID=1844999 RepID=UPI001E2FE690|nr:lacticin RM [Listeria sp. PSOL-1]